LENTFHVQVGLPEESSHECTVSLDKITKKQLEIRKILKKKSTNICTGGMKENVHSEIQFNSRVIVIENELITTFRERDM